MFELDLPIDIQLKINRIENQLWEELDRDTLHEKCWKSDEWILDPGHNAARLSLYERMVALYWVMKNLIMCSTCQEGGDYKFWGLHGEMVGGCRCISKVVEPKDGPLPTFIWDSGSPGYLASCKPNGGWW